MNCKTPTEALFALFKDKFGMSHRDLASLILSDQPLNSGLSPALLSENTSWLSRSVVHAPMEELPYWFFADFDATARRLHRHLRQLGMSDRSVFLTIRDFTPMRDALALSQASHAYFNALNRMACISDEAAQTEAALLLVLVCGCTADASLAVSKSTALLRKIAPTAGGSTPQITIPADSQSNLICPHRIPPDSIALIRLRGSLVTGGPYPIQKTRSGSTIGALATDSGAIADVAIDVSAEHLRIYSENGHWLARDLGSRNGSTLVSSSDSAEKDISSGMPVEIHPGDQLRLGADTTFIVIAMAPDAPSNIRNHGEDSDANH